MKLLRLILHYSCVYLLLRCHFTPLGSYSYPPAFVLFCFLFFVMPLLNVVKLWLATEREKRGWMGDASKLAGRYISYTSPVYKIQPVLLQ